MTYEQALKTFGEISIQFMVGLSMHAGNMQTQNLGQSPAYTEEQFGVVIDMIEKSIERSKNR